MDGPRNWLCKKHGHVLGIIERVHVSRNGRKYHVERLCLLRHAIDLNVDSPAEVDVMAVLEGFAPHIKCEICGTERTWWPGEAALQRMIDGEK